MNTFYNVVLLSTLLLGAQADLPVHCLKQQVEGEWDFTLGPLSSKRSSCGHQRPDIEEGQPARSTLAQPTSMKRVELHSPNVAKMDGNGHGTWTMVYDEGFEVTVGGLNFLAFSNFTFENDPKTHKKHNVSHCGDTMVGWYHNVERTQFGCYYGVKVEKPTPVATPAAPAAKVPPAQQAQHDHATLDSKAMHQKVAKLNKKLSMLQLGWKARVMPKFIGKTMREINSYAGIRRTSPGHDARRQMLSQRKAPRAQSFLQRHRATKFPESFDWGNASGGVDWLEPVMDQADCGSCYVSSSMRMLSVRHKISTNNTEALPWSINLPLHCGEYNQGCKGGYGSLVSKWGEDVGLLPATCMRYNTKGSCKLECDLDKLEGKRYRAANHRFIGGFYGNSSSRAMMEEIYHNGPIVVSFEPAEDFMFYSDGIYKSATKAATPALSRITQPWEQVDHAVLAVGWGVEDGKKYWLVQNSWGQDWGEDGFFRIVRDEDDSGIESIPEAADVVEDENKGQRVKEFFDQMSKSTPKTH